MLTLAIIATVLCACTIIVEVTAISEFRANPVGIIGVLIRVAFIVITIWVLYAHTA
jgi:hypothetical protein